MQASLRAEQRSKPRDALLQLGAISLAVIGAMTFAISKGNTVPVWAFRLITLGGAATLYGLTKFRRSGAAVPLRFDEGVLVIGGRRIDPAALTAAAATPRGSGGIFHLWCRGREFVLTADDTMFALLAGALRPALFRASRTYVPSGEVQAAAELVVDGDGLSFPTGWVRGQGATRTERVPWSEFRRVFVQSGFLVIERSDGELVGPGVSVAPDLEATICQEIEAMQSPAVRDPVPQEVLAALPRVAQTRKDPPAPFRDAPAIETSALLHALAHGPLESRPLAADALVALGAIPAAAAVFVRRGLA